MKAIFLDIDGVVCISKDASGPGSWLPVLDSESVLLINRLCQVDEVLTRVIISSSWRLMFAKELIAGHLGKYGFDTRFIHEDWRTIAIQKGSRGLEIAEWLQRHSNVGDNFLIIDDRPGEDFLSMHRHRHIRPSSENGFRLSEYTQACSILHANSHAQRKTMY
jgi:hypothetical protein